MVVRLRIRDFGFLFELLAMVCYFDCVANRFANHLWRSHGLDDNIHGHHCLRGSFHHYRSDSGSVAPTQENGDEESNRADKEEPIPDGMIGNLCLLWIIGLLLKDYFLQGHDAVTVSDVVRISSLTCLTLVGLLIQALLFALNRLYR